MQFYRLVEAAVDSSSWTAIKRSAHDIQTAPLPGQPTDSILFYWHHLAWG